MELGDFEPELGDGAGGRRLIDDAFFGLFKLGIGSVVEIVKVIGRECRQADVHIDVDLGATFENLLFAKSLLQPFAAAFKGLVDGLRRRREPALQDGQRESDGSFAAFVFQRLGPVEFLANVVGDLLVEFGFGIRQGVIDRVGPAFREQRRAVELEQLLLDQPPHHVRGVGNVHAVAEFPFKAVAVEQGQE